MNLGPEFSEKDRGDVCGDPHEREWHGRAVLQRAEAALLYHPHQLPGADPYLHLHATGENQVSHNPGVIFKTVKLIELFHFSFCTWPLLLRMITSESQKLVSQISWINYVNYVVYNMQVSVPFSNTIQTNVIWIVFFKLSFPTAGEELQHCSLSSVLFYLCITVAE